MFSSAVAYMPFEDAYIQIPAPTSDPAFSWHTLSAGDGSSTWSPIPWRQPAPTLAEVKHLGSEIADGQFCLSSLFCSTFQVKLRKRKPLEMRGIKYGMYRSTMEYLWQQNECVKTLWIKNPRSQCVREQQQHSWVWGMKFPAAICCLMIETHRKKACEYFVF